MRARSLRSIKARIRRAAFEVRPEFARRRCGTNQQAFFEVLLPQIDGLFEHSLDFIVGQAVAGLTSTGMLAAGALIARIDI